MQLPTDDELKLIKDYALLPILLRVFERDRKTLEASLKTPGPYLALVDRAVKDIYRDISVNKSQLRMAGIKVYDEKHEGSQVALKYLYQGYHHSATYKLEFLKVDITEKMNTYLSNEKPS